MPATAKTRTITAKYDGPCRDCSTRINKGELILWTPGFGSIHAGPCPATAPAARAMCPQCGNPDEGGNCCEAALAAAEIADSIAAEAAERKWDAAFAARERAQENAAFTYKMNRR